MTNFNLMRQGKEGLDSGYSLFELLVTLSIAALLLMIALPNLSVLLDKQKLQSRAELLLLAIKNAKVAAINLDQNIIICRKLADQQQCSGASIKGKKDWRNGWLVFADSNSDRLYQRDEKLMNSTSFNASNCQIMWNRGDFLSFGKFGVLQGGKAGSFQIKCAAQTTALVINWVGRVRRIN